MYQFSKLIDEVCVVGSLKQIASKAIIHYKAVMHLAASY